MGLLSPIVNLLGVLSPIHIHFVTIVTGAKKVGTDPLGNKYYRAKARKGYTHDRRWVIYSGVPEASNVPPEWHGWLHHQTDAVPEANAPSYRRVWQKPHRPNLTGTDLAYRPPGHVLSGGQRDKATGDYEAWKPE
ncbi:MAG: NADH:ubiquinone oxidoreductase subunit NDUFA12 [Micavibrio aeruginosavorus]|uniref:NADH:ubiquinone oxidoreductase subunit NDUFA12 n=1 Tax=Micavibrio aeruginosavorus TaxID=349221 RepID=A0A2W5N030_9BACT|nr:MAG: NADH:ubiquinone oxidoreductase subunit NDUFA12 [Micavibrio aeruginosavorus]